MDRPTSHDEVRNRFVVTRSTVYHRAPLWAALIACAATFVATPELSVSKRFLLAAASGIVGFIVFFFVTLWTRDGWPAAVSQATRAGSRR